MDENELIKNSDMDARRHALALVGPVINRLNAQYNISTKPADVEEYFKSEVLGNFDALTLRGRYPNDRLSHAGAVAFAMTVNRLTSDFHHGDALPTEEELFRAVEADYLKRAEVARRLDAWVQKQQALIKAAAKPEAQKAGLAAHPILFMRESPYEDYIPIPVDRSRLDEATECTLRVAQKELGKAIYEYKQVRDREIALAIRRGEYGIVQLPISGAEVQLDPPYTKKILTEPNAPDSESNVLLKIAIDPETKEASPYFEPHMNNPVYIEKLRQNINEQSDFWTRKSAEQNDDYSRTMDELLEKTLDVARALPSIIENHIAPLINERIRSQPPENYKMDWGGVTITYEAYKNPYQNEGGVYANKSWEEGKLECTVPGRGRLLVARFRRDDKGALYTAVASERTLQEISALIPVGEMILAHAATLPKINLPEVEAEPETTVAPETRTPILDIGKLEESEARAALFRAIPEHSRPPRITSAEDEQAQPWRALIGDEALQKIIETQSADFWETGPSAFESEWTFQNAAQTFLDFSTVYAQLSTEDPQTFPAVNRMDDATARAACHKRIGSAIDKVRSNHPDWNISEKGKKIVSKTFIVAPDQSIPSNGYINAFGIEGDTIAEKSKWISTLEPQLVEVLSDGKARMRYTLPYDASNGKNNVRLYTDCTQIGELQIGLNSRTQLVRTLGEYEYMKSRAQQSQSSPAAAERPRPSPIATVNVLPDDRDGEDEGSILGALGVRSATPAAEAPPIPVGNRGEVAAPLSELIATLLISAPDQWRDRLQTGTPDERTLAGALFATKCTIETCVDAGLDYERLKATYAAMSDIIGRLAHDEKSKAEITALRKDLKDAMLRIYLSPIVERVLSEDVEIAPLLTLQPENRPMVIAAIMRDLSALPSVMKEHGKSNLNVLDQGYLSTETVTSAWKHLDALIS